MASIEFAAMLQEALERTQVELQQAMDEIERLREVERKALEQSEYIQKHGLTEWEMALKNAEVERLRAIIDSIDDTCENGHLYIGRNPFDVPFDELKCFRCGFLFINSPLKMVVRKG